MVELRQCQLLSMNIHFSGIQNNISQFEKIVGHLACTLTSWSDSQKLRNRKMSRTAYVNNIHGYKRTAKQKKRSTWIRNSPKTLPHYAQDSSSKRSRHELVCFRNATRNTEPPPPLLRPWDSQTKRGPKFKKSRSNVPALPFRLKSCTKKLDCREYQIQDNAESSNNSAIKGYQTVNRVSSRLHRPASTQ